MPFAQCVVGAPGAGKSTFCHGMAMFIRQHQPARKVRIINLDLANENLPYECDFNACKLVNYASIMLEQQLGPNGALIKACELLLSTYLQDLIDAIRALGEDCYFLFDFPGQVELFTHYRIWKDLISQLEVELGFRFCLVNLTDSTVCLDACKYISSLMLTTKSMLHFETIGTVNLFSKFDLLPLDKLVMPIEFYLQATDLYKHLQHLLERPQSGSGNHHLNQQVLPERFNRLNELVCELVEDFGLVSFVPLAVEDAQCLAFVLHECDKANGFAYATLAFNDSILETHCALPLDEEYLELLKQRYAKCQE